MSAFARLEPAEAGRDAGGRRVAFELATRSATANAALMRGNVARYRAMVPIADDFTLFAPFGGEPTRGRDMSEERWEAVGRFFEGGDLVQEVVEAYSSTDMIVLAVIERATHVAVGGLPARDWALRVTLVYRRDAGRWLLVHRHADPLANGITLGEAARLAEGRAAEEKRPADGGRLRRLAQRTMMICAAVLVLAV